MGDKQTFLAREIDLKCIFRAENDEHAVWESTAVRGEALADPLGKALSKLWEFISYSLAHGYTSLLGPNDETRFKWTWPIHADIDLIQDVYDFKLTAVISAEGEWVCDESQ